MKVYRLSNDSRLMVALAGGHLADGEQTRDELCPNCWGGTSKEKAFSMRREGGKVWYRCFRASCGVTGHVMVYGEKDLDDVVKPERQGDVFRGTLRLLDEIQYAFFWDAYGLNRDDLGRMHVRWSPDYARYSFEVFSRIRINRGMALRSFTVRYPKWLAFRADMRSPWVSWAIKETHERNDCNCVVVVEDQISALKVSKICPAVALLGTKLDLDIINEINQVRGHDGIVKVMLDADATGIAFGQLEKFKFFTDGIWTAESVVRDPKEMSMTELEQKIFSKGYDDHVYECED